MEDLVREGHTGPFGVANIFFKNGGGGEGMIRNDNIFVQWTFVFILWCKNFLRGIYIDFGVITPFCMFRLRIVYVNVLDLVSQVRDVVLMNVYLDLGNSGGRDFGMGGI